MILSILSFCHNFSVIAFYRITLNDLLRWLINKWQDRVLEKVINKGCVNIMNFVSDFFYRNLDKLSDIVNYLRLINGIPIFSCSNHELQ